MFSSQGMAQLGTSEALLLVVMVGITLFRGYWGPRGQGGDQEWVMGTRRG